MASVLPSGLNATSSVPYRLVRVATEGNDGTGLGEALLKGTGARRIVRRIERDNERRQRDEAKASPAAVMTPGAPATWVLGPADVRVWTSSGTVGRGEGAGEPEAPGGTVERLVAVAGEVPGIGEVAGAADRGDAGGSPGSTSLAPAAVVVWRHWWMTSAGVGRCSGSLVRQAAAMARTGSGQPSRSGSSSRSGGSRRCRSAAEGQLAGGGEVRD